MRAVIQRVISASVSGNIYKTVVDKYEVGQASNNAITTTHNKEIIKVLLKTIHLIVIINSQDNKQLKTFAKEIAHIILELQKVDGEMVSSIGPGLCVLVGISRHDTKKDMEYIARKILNTRIFDNCSDGKKWSSSVVDREHEILCVSQVTLYHSFKGNKLDFHHAMAPEPGHKLYIEFLEYLKSQYNPNLIKDGKFGAYMAVNIENDGPVTIVIESPIEKPKVSQPDSKECSTLESTV